MVSWAVSSSDCRIRSLISLRTPVTGTVSTGAGAAAAAGAGSAGAGVCRGGEVGQGHAAADAAPHRGHLGAGRDRGAGGGGKRGPRRSSRNHVAFDDAAAGTAAADRGVVDTQLAGASAGARRDGRSATSRGRRGAGGSHQGSGASRAGNFRRGRCRGGWSYRWRRPGCCAGSGAGLCRRTGFGGRRCGHLLAGLAHRGDGREHRDLLTLRNELCQQRSAGRRLDLEGCLVGLYLAQHLARSDILSRLLEPADDGARLDRLPLSRHYDFRRHKTDAS